MRGMNHELLDTAWWSWQAALASSDGHVRLAVALACAGCAAMGVVASAAARQMGDDGRPWAAAAVLLLVLGVDALYRLDLLAVGLLRELSRAQGWYAQRRLLQAPLAAAVAAGGLLGVWQLRRRGAERRLDGPALAGLALLLTLALLRGVSLHATDLWLQARVAGISVGRHLEALALALFALAALRRIRAR